MIRRLCRTTTTMVAAFLLVACSGSDGKDGTNGTDGTDGTNGTDGTSCTVTDNGDGTKTIDCDDGTSVTVTDGADGSCTVTDNGDGTKTIACSDGTTVTVGDGNPGLNQGETYGLFVDVTIPTPTAGFYATGETIPITISAYDKFGDPVTAAQLSIFNLYMNGPRDPLETKTASALLNASTDRSASSHHYINLKTTTNSNLAQVGDDWVYTTAAVGSEPAGTYTAAVWAVRADTPLDQVMELADVQIGNATVEPNRVGGCGDCHQGASNGKFYFHHIDPGYLPVGLPSLDSVPVRTCKNCHNEDGYAAIRKCDDGSKAFSVSGVYKCADGSNWTVAMGYQVDPIVRRVHGVHMGEHLLSSFNTNASWGDFKDYAELEFPYNVKNCTKCHQTDEWKDAAREPCTACHDNLDFATGDYTPPKVSSTSCTTNANCAGVFSGFNGVCNTTSGKCELQHHFGDDAADGTCGTCHGAGKIADVSAVHAVTYPTPPATLTATLSAPGNGTYYVAGEAPLLSLVVSGVADHNTIDTTTNRAYLFINGPREHRIPGLTSAARAQAVNGADGPWDLTGGSMSIKVGATAITVAASSCTFTAITAATVDEAVACLNGNANFKKLAFAFAGTATGMPDPSGTRVVIVAKPSTAANLLEIVSGPAAMSWTPGVSNAATYAHSTSYAANSWRKNDGDDPKATWTTGAVTYQLDDVATVEPGTYTIFAYYRKLSSDPYSMAIVNFQVGTGTAEKKIATNCADCHGDTKMHGSYPFDVDVCGSCHDYRRQVVDRQAGDPADGWGVWAVSGRSNMGFGAAPISRRVHGMHYAAYVNYPEEIHGSSTTKLTDVAPIIFPQDVRNCVKCHSDLDTWTQKPGRVPCLACHDDDATKAHGALMTYDPTPVDPWNGDEQESCEVCHGEDGDFAPSKVHNIWDPYKPPYPREPE